MADDSGQLGRAAFQGAFANLRPVILSEWPEVSETALTATAGELDQVVALIAERTSHTKALVRRQLEELYRVVTQPADSGAGARRKNGVERGGFGHGSPAVDELISELERRASRVVRELRGGILDGARDRVRGNVLFSLLISIGLGFIVGVVFMGVGRGNGK